MAALRNETAKSAAGVYAGNARMNMHNRKKSRIYAQGTFRIIRQMDTRPCDGAAVAFCFLRSGALAPYPKRLAAGRGIRRGGGKDITRLGALAIGAAAEPFRKRGEQ